MKTICYKVGVWTSTRGMTITCFIGHHKACEDPYCDCPCHKKEEGNFDEIPQNSLRFELARLGEILLSVPVFLT